MFVKIVPLQSVGQLRLRKKKCSIEHIVDCSVKIVPYIINEFLAVSIKNITQLTFYICNCQSVPLVKSEPVITYTNQLIQLAESEENPHIREKNRGKTNYHRPLPLTVGLIVISLGLFPSTTLCLFYFLSISISWVVIVCCSVEKFSLAAMTYCLTSNLSAATVVQI